MVRYLLYYKVYEKSVLLKQGNIVCYDLSDNLDKEKQAIIKSLNDWQHRNNIIVIIKNICVF